jgi:hypothetical protein
MPLPPSFSSCQKGWHSLSSRFWPLTLGGGLAVVQSLFVFPGPSSASGADFTGTPAPFPGGSALIEAELVIDTDGTSGARPLV